MDRSAEDSVICPGQAAAGSPVSPLTIDSMEQAQRNGALICSALMDRPNKSGHWMSQINNKPKRACLLYLVAMTAGCPGRLQGL